MANFRITEDDPIVTVDPVNDLMPIVDTSDTTQAPTGTNKTININKVKSSMSLVKSDVGLGNVDNTSDVSKPVSTAQAAADTAVLSSANAYADNLVDSLKWKADCVAASTGNLVLSGIQTVDGILLVVGNRVLVKDQSTASENGIYVVAAGAWSRSSDANSATEIQGAAVQVDQGTVNADTAWTQTADNISLGSTSIVWIQLGASVPDATETVKGKIEIATQVETDAGTDDLRAVTPLKLETFYKWALKAPLASPTFTGTVTVPTPVNATDAVTKNYVDTTLAPNRMFNALNFN